ncbi:hypothetical protein Trydic_g3063 [Trypoxylus dichotomus]
MIGKVDDDTLEKRKPKPVCLNVVSAFDIFNRFSTLSKLKKVVGYCFRFIRNSKLSRECRTLGTLTNEELDSAAKALLKLAQAQEFSQEIEADGLIRVGGRISKASVAYDRKFPIVIPQRHTLAKLIIKHEHHRHLHAGVQAVLAAVRLNYWTLNGRNAVRSELRGYVTCFKVNPSKLEQRMGDLPDCRVNVSRSFLATGVDYAGPFDMKNGRLRNRKIVKSYVCLFVCFSTKAVHMGLVGDLSADSFLNALKRFTARRGVCKHLYSDNATNFVGKVILNYEEFYTVIAQIEAVLNSRPLAPLTNDPNDLIALSPSHFLIGDYLTAIPEEKVQPPLNRVRRYKQLQQIAQHFWRRWSREYLSSLQQRTKWKETSSSQLNHGHAKRRSLASTTMESRSSHSQSSRQ